MPTSVAGSVRSKASRASLRSRGSKKSYVDESLFGSQKQRPATTAAPAGAAFVSAAELRRIRGQAEKGLKPDAVIIPKTELDRIRGSTKIVTNEEAKLTKKVLDEQKGQQRAAANARKKRMQVLDQERAAKLPPTDFQREATQKKQGLLSKAQNALDEEKDDVKHMNQMCLYSKCVTIRDKQLEEQNRLEAEYRDEERRLDLMMEIERLKNLKHQDELEQKRKQALKQGSVVIIDQIKERELERIREQEMREKEKQLILDQIEQLKEEERRELEEKRETAKRMMHEVEAANQDAITTKEKKKLEEKELEAKIVEEEEQEAEKRRIQEEKEREVQRLRDLQEKAQDRQSEIDALRAKRAFEQQERAEREKERKEKEKQLKIQRELEEARLSQFTEKERRLAEQAKQERSEYSRIISTQKEEEMREAMIDEEKRKILREHANKLRSQITQNEEVKKQERLDYLEEGRKVRQSQAEERARLEMIKKKKLNDLKNLGISDKYTSDLSKKKIQ
ncbi:unnamed protein product [Moneuplotes crassus]|uniref:Cilia- and flagella-associated protein 45 n=1 Tax=Euplotes crassus TaxID=5936 RepID=A0AAD1UFY6_EUPCR|nr:unnamed protein product [Moneuplotes crassus]